MDLKEQAVVEYDQRIVRFIANKGAGEGQLGSPRASLLETHSQHQTTRDEPRWSTEAKLHHHRAVRAQHAQQRTAGWLCACAGLRLWLLRKASDLGLDVMSAMGGEETAGCEEAAGSPSQRSPTEEAADVDEDLVVVQLLMVVLLEPRPQLL